MDETFGKSVNVKDFFPNVEKLIKSVSTLQKVLRLDLLDEKKPFCLKKHAAGLGKRLGLLNAKKKVKISK